MLFGASVTLISGSAYSAHGLPAFHLILVLPLLTLSPLPSQPLSFTAGPRRGLPSPPRVALNFCAHCPQRGPCLEVYMCCVSVASLPHGTNLLDGAGLSKQCCVPRMSHIWCSKSWGQLAASGTEGETDRLVHLEGSVEGSRGPKREDGGHSGGRAAEKGD